MQHLLAEAVWDHDGIRDDVRALVVEHLGDPGAVLVVDETRDLKKGTATVGVQRQYTGTAGKVDNAQVAVYLAYATTAGHRVIDRELYLPRGWLADAERCQVAGVPDRVGLATKPKLARVMLDRALEAGVPAGWVTCRWLPWSRSPEPADGSRRRLQAGKGLCGLDQHQVPPLALLVPLGDLGPAGVRVLGGGRSHPTRPPPTTVRPHPVDLQRAPAPVRHARRRPHHPQRPPAALVVVATPTPGPRPHLPRPPAANRP
jgi:hypothetical protein